MSKLGFNHALQSVLQIASGETRGDDEGICSMRQQRERMAAGKRFEHRMALTLAAIETVMTIMPDFDQEFKRAWV